MLLYRLSSTKGIIKGLSYLINTINCMCYFLVEKSTYDIYMFSLSVDTNEAKTKDAELVYFI